MNLTDATIRGKTRVHGGTPHAPRADLAGHAGLHPHRKEAHVRAVPARSMAAAAVACAGAAHGAGAGPAAGGAAGDDEGAREESGGRNDECGMTNLPVMKALKTKWRTTGRLSPPHGRGSWKAAWREIGGQRKFFRSRWEANYARYLEWLKSQRKIIRWEHEPDVFWFEGLKRGCVSYLPDFKVTMADGTIEYHEVKGWMDAQSKTKLKRMAKYFPSVYVEVIGADWFRSNSKMLGIICQWERGRGE